MADPNPPHVVVLSSLFPSSIQPGTGLFVRERMFRVGQHLPLAVVVPTPWFPLQGLLRHIKPHFRPGAPHYERQNGFDVWYPRFFSLPGMLKRYDGLMMALGAWPIMRQLKREGRLDIIDAHFAYPDGYAASLLGRWFTVPFTVTMRGTESRHIQDRSLGRMLLQAIRKSVQVFSVSESLRGLAISHGADPAKIEVIGNGVDTARFSPRDRQACRRALGISPDARVLVSVGGLVARKGFHRILGILPRLRETFPSLIYLIVGGPSAEGNNRVELEAQVKQLELDACVRFLGALSPDELPEALSAADVFVLATSNEGWANVFLEALACGLPVVTTDVGGNREVICDAGLGVVVPFDDAAALTEAISASLLRSWDAGYIRLYAEENSWDERVRRLCNHFFGIGQGHRGRV